MPEGRMPEDQTREGRIEKQEGRWQGDPMPEGQTREGLRLAGLKQADQRQADQTREGPKQAGRYECSGQQSRDDT
jgi:hypothetical protein